MLVKQAITYMFVFTLKVHSSLPLIVFPRDRPKYLFYAKVFCKNVLIIHTYDYVMQTEQN